MKTKLKKDDTVMVIAGKDKGKTGRVLKIDRDAGRILVEGVNMVKKAQKKRNQNDTGGIIERESPVNISNVMYVGKDGKPTRLGFRLQGSEKVRFSRKTGETI
ncbi:MAG: 50S ribosomal protein L24 [Spirochaetaceae bacterium]|nr:MAG: 50S ribosomal protein L24 [Spirochaetaceae bacterium]